MSYRFLISCLRVVISSNLSFDNKQNHKMSNENCGVTAVLYLFLSFIQENEYEYNFVCTERTTYHHQQHQTKYMPEYAILCD